MPEQNQQSGAAVNATVVEHLYRSQMRVHFSWDRLREGQWPIDLVVMDNVEALSRWFVPWYLREDHEVHYDQPHAEPLRLVDVARQLSSLNGGRRRLIETIADDLKRHSDPLHLDLPVYSLGEAGLLVLDRNHRLSALLLADRPFRLITFRIRGPIDPRVLPDLIHWSTTRSSRWRASPPNRT